MTEFTIFLRGTHYWLSRVGFGLGLVMLALALYIGLIQHGDVTRYFRHATYTLAGLMVVEAIVGALMYFGVGLRPFEEVHLVYGMGAMLALPFFIFVETTAKKRPAMGSYIWGFSFMAAIMLRCFVTGAAV